MGYCDIKDGCEFKTASELVNAPIYDGKIAKKSMGQGCDYKHRELSYERLDAVFPSCVKLVVAKISEIIMRTLNKRGKENGKG